MAQVRPIETDTLTCPSEDGIEVVMKRRASFGDSRRAQSAALKVIPIDPANPASQGVAEIEFGPYLSSLLCSLIVSWNLTDANNQPLPVTPANLDLLSAEDGQFLGAEATRRAGVRGASQEAPFGKPSSTPSTATT